MHVLFTESHNIYIYIFFFFFTFFFTFFNLDFSHARILRKCIGSRYLVSETPLIVLGQSFQNLTGVSEDMHVLFTES